MGAAPIDPRYYTIPQQAAGYHQHKHTAPRQSAQSNQQSNDAMSTLFGITPNNY